MENRWGKVETVTDFIYLSSKITANGDCSHEIKRCFLLGRKAKTNLTKQHIKKQRYHFANKGPYGQSYDFSSSHVQISVGPLRRLRAKELMLSNCDAGEIS